MSVDYKTMGVQLYDIKIKEITKETEDCVSLTFDIPNDLKNEFNFFLDNT